MKNSPSQNKQALGTILTDFQTLLDFVSSGKQLVSKKQMVFSSKRLNELNQLMSYPMAHKKTRPVQKTFPHISILFECAKNYGFFFFTNKGSQKRITLNQSAVDSWNKLNSIEQYFALFSQWLLGSNNDVPDFLSPINQIPMFLSRWVDKRRFPFTEILKMEYKIDVFLAGLQLFGLADIKQGKPAKGSGWKITSIKLTQDGLFFLELIQSNADQINEFHIFSSIEERKKFKEKQIFNIFKPYYPDLKTSYKLELDMPNRTGLHIFKITRQKTWRRVALSHKATLYDLADVILQVFDFDDDHLHSFEFIDLIGNKREYSHPGASDSELFTDEITLATLPLPLKGSMKFIFDFGDWWEFEIIFEKVDNEIKTKKSDFILLEEKGKAPEQYPDWDY